MKTIRHPMLALALAALLAGCGPGVGGTGTGQGVVFVEVFGATPAPLCSADFAAALACAETVPSTGVGEPPSPLVALGTQPASYTDNPVAPTVTATFNGNGIELAAPCRRLRLVGDWGSSPGLGARFYGVVESADGTVSPASLTVRAAGTAPALEVVLYDAAGRVLLGPLPLTRVPQPPAPSC